VLGKDNVIQSILNKIKVVKIVVGTCAANLILATMANSHYETLHSPPV